MAPNNAEVSIKDRFVIWMFQQGTSTVLLVLLTCVVTYFGYYAMTTAIPQHLKTIQEGYEKQEANHSAVVDKFVNSMERQQQLMRDDRETFKQSLREAVRETIKDTIRETNKN